MTTFSPHTEVPSGDDYKITMSAQTQLPGYLSPGSSNMQMGVHTNCGFNPPGCTSVQNVHTYTNPFKKSLHTKPLYTDRDIL